MSGRGQPRANPFSTRAIRPGALPYLFPEGESAVGLVDRLRTHGWRGQIIGPHGSGKTTLLATLAEPLAAAGRPMISYGLHDGQRHMPRGWTQAAEQCGARLIAVDGYEQLGRAGRLALGFQCWRRGWGLLVTAHADVGLSTLFCTPSTVEIAQAVVERLLDSSGTNVGPDDIARCFAAAGGNVRETLFALYDVCDAQRRAAS